MIIVDKTSDNYVFVKRFSTGKLIILLQLMDVMLIVSHNAKKIQSLKGELIKSFIMKDLAVTKKILSMKITCDRKNKRI